MSGALGPGASGRERFGVIGLAALIVLSVAAYLALRASVIESTAPGHLLPYQTLARTLVSSDQVVFGELRDRYLGLEADRIRRGRWPEASALQGGAGYRWTRSDEGLFVNYLATPVADGSESAWLVVIREPDPQAPPDPSPNDETHRRLPDGTILHVTYWTHRFGGEIAPGFVRQPETSGWTQVLTAPLPAAPSGS